MSRLFIMAFLVSFCFPLSGFADRYALVLTGAGGTVEYEERFRSWTSRLYENLVGTLDFLPDRVHVYADPVEGASFPIVPITAQSVRERFASLANTLTEHDDLFVFMIGHGSWIREESRFHIPGEDLTADDMLEWITGLETRSFVLINTTSSSAGFINTLSDEGRIICTATRDPSQVNATEFMEHFLQGIEDLSADRNRDEQISVLEACERAAELTGRWYEEQGYIVSETALLEDNGDHLGSRLPIAPPAEDEDPDTLDGVSSSAVWLLPFPVPEGVPAGLLERYVELLATIDTIKGQKATLSSEEYYNTLEEKLIEAARVNQKIKSYKKKTEKPQADSNS